MKERHYPIAEANFIKDIEPSLSGITNVQEGQKKSAIISFFALFYIC